MMSEQADSVHGIVDESVASVALLLLSPLFMWVGWKLT